MGKVNVDKAKLRRKQERSTVEASEMAATLLGPAPKSLADCIAEIVRLKRILAEILGQRSSQSISKASTEKQVSDAILKAVVK